MLTIERLTVRFGSVTALDGVTLSLEAGAVHGLVGRNGAGKTSLLEAVYGFREFGGEILFDGVPPTHRDLAYVPTRDDFFPRITGREYLTLFRGRHPHFDEDAWADILNLPLDRQIDGYSAGMQKKVALLAALSLARPLLLLDEPGNNLDLESNLLLGRLLRALADGGQTVLVTSHVLESLTGVCDRIHVLEDGLLARSVEPADFDQLEGELVRSVTAARIERVRTLVAELNRRRR